MLTPRKKPRSRLGDSPDTVTLRIKDADVVNIQLANKPTKALFERAALEWSYTVRNRSRWKQAGRNNEVAGRAIEMLGKFGVSENELRQLARASRVEVRTPFTQEEDGWAGRIMPWEYVLTAATSSYRGREPLCVFRHLHLNGAMPSDRAKDGLLIVCCNPGPIDEQWNFEDECALVSSVFEADRTTVKQLTNPNASSLLETVQEFSPSVIHLVGVDAHQGMELFGIGSTSAHGARRSASKGVQDGIVLAHEESGVPTIVPFTRIASILCAAAAKPQLVVYNAFNSGPRIAPMTVAHGAVAAVGFQDSIQDYFAERLLIEFYSSWLACNRNLAEAFEFAWSRLRSVNERRIGTGVTLWSSQSQLDADPVNERLTRSNELEDLRSKPVFYPDVEEAKKAIRLTLSPLSSFNYSLLHNRQPCFEKFELVHLRPGVAQGIVVIFDVHAGSETLSFKGVFDVPQSPLDLTAQVFIPLTSALLRSLTESIRSTVTVTVLLPNGCEIYRRTCRVSLLPLNEWVDDDRSRHWLPSFVFPLDPAVSRVIREAQSYVQAIADDPAAGFDGYQGIDRDRDHEDSTASVDHQVAAIWTALLERLPLKYINPPPTYSANSQRLRTPSDILENGRGTCIDLALLMASCLEYIDIYPVIFLLRGHAFPGYWRSDDDWEEFFDMRSVSGLEDETMKQVTSEAKGAPAGLGWRVDGSRYSELIDQMRQGNLVPLETVLLTARGSFADAQQEGWENVLSEREFDCMIDVVAARHASEPVTPLPILRSAEA